MRAWLVVVGMLGWQVSPALAQPAPSAIDAKDGDGWTALQRAAMGGKVAEIERLVHAGASLEATDPHVYQGATAVEIALDYSNGAAAEKLLELGASIAPPHDANLLELASREGEDRILVRLLAHGVSPAGTRALAYAAHYDHATAIARLLRAGARVDEIDHDDHDYTPLIVACQNNAAGAARALVAAGAKVNARDSDGMTVLHWAVYGARPDEIHVYRDLGKPHDTMYIAHAAAPIVELLVAHGAKVDAIDGDGNTALHEAVFVNAAAAARVLIHAGARRSIRNHDGQTALDIARGRQNDVEPELAH
ncbi:MAG TPA: ankyrin repeat domain-containing protein [Kofleriaceae bacterium]